MLSLWESWHGEAVTERAAIFVYSGVLTLVDSEERSDDHSPQ